MNTRSKALIKYYARLIQKGTYTIDNVPEELQPCVSQLLDAATANESPK